MLLGEKKYYGMYKNAVSIKRNFFAKKWLEYSEKIGTLASF